jgi:hypothetical protein
VRARTTTCGPGLLAVESEPNGRLTNLQFTQDVPTRENEIYRGAASRGLRTHTSV